MYTRQRTRKRYLQFGRTVVSIVKGNIEEQETDVIVNTTNAELDLENAGQCSKAISKAGGSSIQEDCKKRYPRPLTVGEVAVTTSGTLKSSKVFHIYLPNGKEQRNQQNVEKTVNACLEQMELLSLKSIAFPALGTGGLNYCPCIVINALFDAVKDYNNRPFTTVIENVACVIFQEQMFQTVVSEARKRSRCLGSPKIQVSGGTKYLNTNIQILVGDIILQEADVLVYSSPHNMKLNTGKGLSTDILNVAGSDIQDELDLISNKVVECGTFAVTNGYNLRCSKVYHGYLPSFCGPNYRPEKLLSTFVSKCLIEANTHKAKCVVFSALGSGMLKYPTDVAASAVITGIQTFVSCNPTSNHIDNIKIVVYGGDSNYSRIEQAYRSELTATKGTCIYLRDTTNQPIPRRGTKVYFCFKYNEEPRPPTNWSFFKSFRTIKDWSKERRGRATIKKQGIDKNTFESIKNLFMNTIQNPNAKIKSITRNENLNLYLKYFQRCQELFRKAIVNGPSKPLATPVLTIANLNRQMRDVLEQDINEVYLFHGTKQDRVKVLLRNGFDERLAAMNFPKLRLGSGTYTAEDASLSAHYTEKQGVRTMFLVRACLGDVFRTNENLNDLKRPPCKKMCKTICTQHDEFFDSVLGEFCPREFVVYEKAQCYPEYVIKYTL
ncbi:protein mono-ADP-ribosyltransferase PARP14-like isoform X2 [Mytilus trossulus]|uniref:protein mono-ADP-ribosyltransferase PARP14-like isoform X2 n=1 Tax=Mytilus trossulus TaxID=6551 RepID=UPI0030072BA7